jgi:hypothetical protein
MVIQADKQTRGGHDCPMAACPQPMFGGSSVKLSADDGAD